MGAKPQTKRTARPAKPANKDPLAERLARTAAAEPSALFYKGRPTLPHFTVVETEMLEGAGFKVDKEAGKAANGVIRITRQVSKIDGRAVYLLEDKDIMEVYRNFGRVLFAAGTLLVSD